MFLFFFLNLRSVDYALPGTCKIFSFPEVTDRIWGPYSILYIGWGRIFSKN